MKTNAKRALLAAAVVLAIAIGFTQRRLHATAEDENNDKSDRATLAVAPVATVKRQPIADTFSVTGEFDPYQEVELHAKVAGYIKKIYVDIGDRVRTGQVLAILEVPELNAQVEGANAGVKHSDQEIARARNEVARAEADHAALHAAAARIQQASQARTGLIAEQELDDAQAKDRASEAQVEAAKSALSAAEQQLDVSKASASQVSAMQGYSKIVAPFDGVITWRYADTGALIQAGTSNSSSMPVVKLAQSNLLRLRIPIPESLAGKVHRGDSADVHVQATDEHFKGKIMRLTDSFDRSTRAMQVEIDVPNPKYHLAPGMYADVVLQTQSKPEALTIPVQALLRNGDKSSVMVVDAQNHVGVREVQTGIESPNRVEVISGLKEGDKVISGNQRSYQEGQTVEPKVTVMASDNGVAN